MRLSIRANCCRRHLLIPVSLCCLLLAFQGEARGQSRVINDPVEIDATLLSKDAVDKLQPYPREKPTGWTVTPRPQHTAAPAKDTDDHKDRVITVERKQLYEVISSKGLSDKRTIELLENAVGRGDSPPFRRRPEIEQVFGPEDSIRQVKEVIAAIRADCGRVHGATTAEYKNCVAKSDVAALETVNAEMLQALSGNQCARAASNYKEYLAQYCRNACAYNAAVFAPFDDECLYSLIPWQRANGTMRGDPQPPAFVQGGLRDGRQGILDAMALIEILDGNSREHLCGALLLSGNRILTARHCFNRSSVQQALRESRIYVRLVRDIDGQGWPLIPQPLGAPAASVSTDTIELRFDAPEQIAAPRVQFLLPQEPGGALVLGRFVHYNPSRKLEGTDSVGGALAISNWRKSLRWSREGLCQTMSASTSCVTIRCLTVEGYSGTPVFAASQSPSEALVVYGLVSRPIDANADCGVLDGQSTLVATATHVSP